MVVSKLRKMEGNDDHKIQNTVLLGIESFNGKRLSGNYGI